MNLLPGLLVLLGLMSSMTDGQEIKIVPEREIVIKPIGESLVFQCFVHEIGEGIDPQLIWFDQASLEINDRTGRKYIENEGLDRLKLYIQTIEADDSGTYSCRGRVNGSPVEKQIDLMLYQDITFEHAPSIQYPRIYTDAVIQCRVSGQPSPTVSWRFEEIKVIDGGRYTYTYEGLRINNITEADNGLYSCRAEVAVEGRFDSRPITVEVHIPPTITKQLGDNEGTMGQEATISCRAQAKPDAKYEFYRGSANHQLFSTDNVIVDRDLGTVHFRNLHRDDENEYTCKAVNDVGFAETTGYLNVIVPPRIIRLENTTALETTTGELICVSEGDPAPTMTFQKAGEEPYAPGENEGGRVVVEIMSDNNLKLTINNLRPTDTSNYTCRTENVGGVFFKNGTIGVQFEPRFAEDHVTQYYNWAGRRRNMTCFAQGEPEPNVNWVRHGIPLQNNETYIVYKEGRTSKLQVYIQEGDQSWIYGVYQCRAENTHGLMELDIELERAEVPGKPQGVDVRDSSPTMVRLAIQPPEEDGGMPVTAYRIEYDGFSTEFALSQAKPAGDIIKLENLQPTTTYVFNIRAKNEVGVGVGLEHSITTDSIRQPYPIVLTSDPEGPYPYSYVLRWETPRTGGLDIREYEFKYRRVSVHDGTFDIKKPEGDYTRITVQDDYRRPMRTYTLGELKPSSYYQVEVMARNDIGWSVQNPAYVFSTAEGPNPAAATLMGLSTGAIIGIVIAVFFIFLLIVDISCYFMNDCGVLMCICVHLCGKQQPGAKEKAMEEGESEEKLPVIGPDEEEDDIKKGDLIEDHEERLDHDDDETKEKLKEEMNVEEETNEKTPLTDDTTC